MALQTQSKYSFEEYLAVERELIEEKHEYVAGHVFAMVGATYNHNIIVTNTSRCLGNQLEARPCVVLVNDMRVWIETADACTYPDIVALCDEPRFHDKRRDVLTNPTLLVEVLSPSTEAYDRGGKFALYRALPSLREYLLIAQDRQSVELFTRQPNDRWLLTAYDMPDDEVLLESIQCRIKVREIYDKVRFEMPEPISGGEPS